MNRVFDYRTHYLIWSRPAWDASFQGSTGRCEAGRDTVLVVPAFSNARGLPVSGAVVVARWSCVESTGFLLLDPKPSAQLSFAQGGEHR